MNKTFKGVIIGAVLLGVLSGVCGFYVSLTSNTVGSFGIENKDFWWLAMICGALLGGLVNPQHRDTLFHSFG